MEISNHRVWRKISEELKVLKRDNKVDAQDIERLTKVVSTTDSFEEVVAAFEKLKRDLESFGVPRSASAEARGAIDTYLLSIENDAGESRGQALVAQINAAERSEEANALRPARQVRYVRKAFREFTREYGEGTARYLVQELFLRDPKVLEGLSTRKLERLHNEFGTFTSHQEGFKAVLESATGELRSIIDFDLSGDLSDGDAVVRDVPKNKQPIISELNAVSAAQISMNMRVVRAAQDLAAADPAFEKLRDHRFNEQFWDVEPNGRANIKGDVEPSDGIRDIFANPEHYGFECATAMMVVYYKAILDEVGDEAFNKLFVHISLMSWDKSMPFKASYQVKSGETFSPSDTKRMRANMPGEHGYIRNFDVSPEGRAAGWQGENVILVGYSPEGEKLFYGHPFGIAPESEIVDYLNEHRNEDSTISAGEIELSAFLHGDKIRKLASD